MEQLTASVRALIHEVAERFGVEVVDLEIIPGGRRRVLRMYIDQPGGVGHQDCAFVSRKVGEALDQKDSLPFPYDLEVSSPGINRPLTQIQHFDRFRGEQADVELKLPLDGRRHFKGRLDGVEGNDVRFVLEGEEPLTLPLENIRRARLAVDPWERIKKERNQ